MVWLHIFQGSDIMKELYIDTGITQSRAAIFDDGKLIDLYLENVNRLNIAGNIYKGRIENILPSLNAAFVNIGIGKNAIFHIDTEMINNKFKRGQEILIQVVREATGEKGAKVTTEVSLPGKFIVLLPYSNKKYVSRKINDKELLREIDEIYNNLKDYGYGIIFRTECAEASGESIVEEYRYLMNLWEGIRKKSDYLKAPQIVFDSREFYNYIVREYLKHDIEKIYVDKYHDYQYFSTLFEGENLKDKLYYDEYNFKPSSYISGEIKKLLDERINLPSGGYLIINRTEAFTAIDVNTGSYIGGREKEDTILRTNLEACEEIFRIIKLWNISGIILMDFIDMCSGKNKREVLNHIEEIFKKDRVPNRVFGFTSLGLLEVSRSKKGKSLHENIYSKGYNTQYEVSYILKEIENTCIRQLKHYKKSKFKVYIEPELLMKIENNYNNYNEYMKNRNNIDISFIKSLGVYGFSFEEELKGNDITLIFKEKLIRGRLIEFDENSNGEVILKFKRCF